LKNLQRIKAFGKFMDEMCGKTRFLNTYFLLSKYGIDNCLLIGDSTFDLLSKMPLYWGWLKIKGGVKFL